ncbi:MAG: radical SAM protein [Firmicutes bacterium]|nr:radical SAM protein [Bacillota bacterium]
MSEEEIDTVCSLRSVALEVLEDLSDSISEWKPFMLCYSFTFGVYRFAERLFSAVKKKCPEILIVAGGSNCSPAVASELLDSFSDLDYVLCDETPQSLVELINILESGKLALTKNMASRSSGASEILKLQDMDDLPCPDFDDYFDITDRFGIKREMITLPYELSRGCWWAEKKPCTMCGFFGHHKCYSSKSPEKVISELAELSQKYSVSRFRFSDLVQPKAAYIKELLPLEDLGLKLFWELRPDTGGGDFALLRRIGMTFGQIGIESLSDEALKWMNKGTFSLQNIYALMQASKYKIELVWNYMYGLPGESEKWYVNAAEVISKIHHLQPPIPRRMWINRYSPIFESAGGACAEDGSVLDSIFVQDDDSKMVSAHNILLDAIEQWRLAYNRGAVLYVLIRDDFSGIVKGDGYHDEMIPLDPEELLVYLYYSQPHSLSEGVKNMGLEERKLKMMLDKFTDMGLMIIQDDIFLAVATGHSQYKWVKYKEQVMYLGDEMFHM